MVLARRHASSPSPTAPWCRRRPPEQLAQIALAAARDRTRLVGDSPASRLPLYSTKGSAEGPTVARVREAAARFRELAPNIVADGELQADAALMPEVAERKAPGLRRWRAAPTC